MNPTDLKVPKHRDLALIRVTSHFLMLLDEHLYASEFELAMRKNRWLAGDAVGVNYLHDYCDANQIMLDALATVFPNAEVDPTEPVVGKFIDDVFALATKWCGEVWR